MPLAKNKKLRKIWHFIWKEDSILSWIVNIILAFVIVKFLIFPGLGFILQTNYPVVAVVSCSMEHNLNSDCSFNHIKFDEWWQNGKWYEENGFTKEEVQKWKFSNGFNKGDIMILKGIDIENIKNGDVIVFKKSSGAPIIHRVVKIYTENDVKYITTKGDNGVTNPIPRPDEKKISNNDIIGKAVFRIPFLGWVKIIFVNIFR